MPTSMIRGMNGGRIMNMGQRRQHGRLYHHHRHALQNEPAMTNAAILTEKVEKVDCNAYTDYCFWGGLVPDNFDELEACMRRAVLPSNPLSDRYHLITAP